MYVALFGSSSSSSCSSCSISSSSSSSSSVSNGGGSSSSSSNGRIKILNKFVWQFFENLSRKFQDSLTPDNNKPYFTWRSM